MRSDGTFRVRNLFIMMRSHHANRTVLYSSHVSLKLYPKPCDYSHGSQKEIWHYYLFLPLGIRTDDRLGFRDKTFLILTLSHHGTNRPVLQQSPYLTSI